MTAPEINFSELVNKPKETVSKLQRSQGRYVRVRRRDGEDLVLATASRAAAETEVSSVTTKLFVALMQRDERVRALVTEVLPVAFPWVRFLPKEDVQAFIVELVEVLESAESLQNPAPVAHVITTWRNTANVHADPELLAILQQEGEDLGPVAEPDAMGA
ncbi:hypothetical protein ABZ863_25855 [Saccharomonospora sp. NPDC046836]|uniref:hypothetical protein n=1 Tax=Saccharomonospora sp. NPDC046836 TaxID=3156921 RepID=UPI0033F58201